MSFMSGESDRGVGAKDLLIEPKPKNLLQRLKDHLKEGSVLDFIAGSKGCSAKRKTIMLYATFLLGAVLSHLVLIYSLVRFFSFRSLKASEYKKTDSISLIVVPNKDTFAYKALSHINILWRIVMSLIPVATVLTIVSLITLIATKTVEQGGCIDKDDTKMFGIAYMCLSLWFMVRTSALQSYLVKNVVDAAKVAKLKINDFNRYVSSLMLTSILGALPKTEESLTKSPDILIQGLLKRLPGVKKISAETLARFIFTTSLYKHYITTYQTAESTVQPGLKATLLAALKTFDPVQQLANNLQTATPCFEYLKKGTLQLRMMSSDATYYANYVAPVGVSQTTYVQAVTMVNSWMGNVRRKHMECLKSLADDNIGTPILNIYFLLMNMIPFFYYTLPLTMLFVGIAKKIYNTVMGNGGGEK